MPLKLPRFERTVPLVNDQGKPTETFHIWWQSVVDNLETAFNNLESAVLDIAAAQAAAEAAQAEAEVAQAEAEVAKRNDKISASFMEPTSVLTASDAGSDATVSVLAHTRYYGDGTSVAVTGGTITGLAYETEYFIYYDDTTTADTTPTFQSTTDVLIAQPNQTAGRHFVGSVTTPASGGGDTGGGGSPPWWKL